MAITLEFPVMSINFAFEIWTLATLMAIHLTSFNWCSVLQVFSDSASNYCVLEFVLTAARSEAKQVFLNQILADTKLYYPTE